MEGSTEPLKAEDNAKEEDPSSLRETKNSSANQDGVLRENMVDLATRFLTNSRVQSSSMEQRRAFLKKKGKLVDHFPPIFGPILMILYLIIGLSDAEIDKAVQAAQQQGVLVPAASNQIAAGTGPAAPPPLPPRPLAALPPQRRSWSELAVMAAVVGGVGYAVVYFIRVRSVK